MSFGELEEDFTDNFSVILRIVAISVVHFGLCCQLLYLVL